MRREETVDEKQSSRLLIRLPIQRTKAHYWPHTGDIFCSKNKFLKIEKIEEKKKERKKRKKKRRKEGVAGGLLSCSKWCLEYF